MSVEHIPDTLADHWQELVTRCGFSVSFDAEGVFISENCSNGRTARFSEGIAAISALHLEIIENQLQRLQEVEQENVALRAKIERLEGPFTYSECEQSHELAKSDFKDAIDELVHCVDNANRYLARRFSIEAARGREGE